tara:strand:- start:1385 stop:1840 length:456 start_codon:yes stop_codon:yes gene_type:complete
MSKMILTPKIRKAFLGAHLIHGRNAKSKIRECWMYGSYGSNCLEEFAATLQVVRNSEGGRELLDRTKFKELDCRANSISILGKLKIPSRFFWINQVGEVSISENAFEAISKNKLTGKVVCRDIDTDKSFELYSMIRVAIPAPSAISKRNCS